MFCGLIYPKIRLIFWPEKDLTSWRKLSNSLSSNVVQKLLDGLEYITHTLNLIFLNHCFF